MFIVFMHTFVYLFRELFISFRNYLCERTSMYLILFTCWLEHSLLDEGNLLHHFLQHMMHFAKKELQHLSAKPLMKLQTSQCQVSFFILSRLLMINIFVVVSNTFDFLLTFLSLDDIHYYIWLSSNKRSCEGTGRDFGGARGSYCELWEFWAPKKGAWGNTTITWLWRSKENSYPYLFGNFSFVCAKLTHKIFR